MAEQRLIHARQPQFALGRILFCRWRIDGPTVMALLKGERPIPPNKERRERPEFQEAIASLQKHGGEWEEITAVGWSPATTSWVEVVAIVRKDE